MAKPLSFYGQINLSEIKNAMDSGHVVAKKITTKKGEQVVIDINVWVHDEADQYNNNAAVQMVLKKEAFEANVNNSYYIGNLKYKTPVSQEVPSNEASSVIDDITSNGNF